YDTTTGDFHGLAVPGDTTAFGELRDSTLLVAPGLAQAQRERERKREQATAETDDTSESSGGAIEHTPAAAPAAGARKQRQPEPSVTRNARYEARVEVDPSGDMEQQLVSLAREVLNHLAKAEPSVLDISLEVSADRSDGFDERTVRTVSENARTLSFARNRFEDGP